MKKISCERILMIVFRDKGHNLLYKVFKDDKKRGENSNHV
jgi:hypothetical protein